MGAFVSGDVVVVPFPFSDLSATKRRPARVLVDLSGDNVNITIPAGTMEIDQSYQLVLDATDDTGLVWTRTREYRAVAG